MFSSFPPPPTYYLNVSTFPPVSRSSPQLPATGLALRLRMDSIVQASGLASKVVDGSANLNDCNASGTGRPAVVASACNGKPGLAFDGSATFMVSGNDVVPSASDRTVFFVGKATAGTNLGGIYFDFRTGATDMYCAMGLSGTPYTVGGGAVNGAFHAANYASNVYQLIEIHVASTVPTAYINGVAFALDGAASLESDAGSDGYSLGGRFASAFQGFTGVACELDVFDHDVSGAELAAARAYFADYYGLTIS